ncbi:hypothetical protein D3C72_2055080 [compost metagenome]
MVSGLLSLLDLYGHAALQAALSEALAAGSYHLAGVRQVLERRRRDQGRRPPIAVTLPDDPRVREMVVVPHALEAYDALKEGEE